MQIKIDGKLTKIQGTSTLESLKRKMKKPHLCSSCSAVACIGGRKLKNAAIKNAIKASNGVYVLDCDDYIEDKKIYQNIKEEIIVFSSPSECSIMHPNVKHTFIR